MQRIAFARAIAHNPKILIADEPTANLDTKTGHNLIELVFLLAKKEKCTIVLSTHDQELIKFADKIVNLLDGRQITK
jgi:putative ABC transport system ATP-binding protein